jgi:hypothetical protein
LGTRIAQSHSGPKQDSNPLSRCCNWHALQQQCFRTSIIYLLLALTPLAHSLPPSSIDSNDPLLLSLQETPYPQPICSKVHTKSIKFLRTVDRGNCRSLFNDVTTTKHASVEGTRSRRNRTVLTSMSAGAAGWIVWPPFPSPFLW